MSHHLPRQAGLKGPGTLSPADRSGAASLSLTIPFDPFRLSKLVAESDWSSLSHYGADVLVYARHYWSCCCKILSKARAPGVLASLKSGWRLEGNLKRLRANRQSALLRRAAFGTAVPVLVSSVFSSKIQPFRKSPRILAQNNRHAL
jgi:hypothetical protein